MPGMPHLHEKIDFTVAIFVVHEGRVLVIHYRKLDKWLPLGGHIELDEDPSRRRSDDGSRESSLRVGRPTCGPGRIQDACAGASPP